MWRTDDHFSIFLYPKQEDADRLRELSQIISHAFPGLFIAPPDTYRFPIAIYHFRFPLPVKGEKYVDTIGRYLAAFNGCDLWYPGNLRFRPHSLLINEHNFHLYLTPSAASDQTKLTRLTQELKDHYGCEPCSPVITFAQLNLNKLFPADALEKLEDLLQSLDFEITAELTNLTPEIMYDNKASDPGTRASAENEV